MFSGCAAVQDKLLSDQENNMHKLAVISIVFLLISSCSKDGASNEGKLIGLWLNTESATGLSGIPTWIPTDPGKSILR
jgi:hypothetical protein